MFQCRIVLWLQLNLPLAPSRCWSQCLYGVISGCSLWKNSWVILCVSESCTLGEARGFMLCFHTSYAYEVWKLLFLGKMLMSYMYVSGYLLYAWTFLDVFSMSSRCLLERFQSDSRASKSMSGTSDSTEFFQFDVTWVCQLLSRIP
jgi:hypothetical protein